MLKQCFTSALMVTSLLVAMQAEAATLTIDLDSSIPATANLNIAYRYFDGTQQQSATLNDFQRGKFSAWLQAFNGDIAKFTNLGANATISVGYMDNGHAVNPTTCQAIPLKVATDIHFTATGCTAL